MPRRRGLPLANESANASMTPPAAGLAQASATPIHGPAPIDRSVSILREKHRQGILRALDVGDQPAVGTFDQNEIQRDRAAVVGEGGGDIGPVVLPSQDGNRDGADLPRRTLHQEIIGLVLQGNPRFPQTPIEKLPRGGGIVRQPVGEFGRPVAVIGVDIPDQRFRRAESIILVSY